MRKFEKRPTEAEGVFAAEMQSARQKVKDIIKKSPTAETPPGVSQEPVEPVQPVNKVDKVNGIPEDGSDPSHDEPVNTVDEAIKVLESEGVEVHAESGVAEKSFSDVMPSSEFYPDMPRAPLSDILGKTLRIHDAQIIEDYDGKFGPSTFVLMLCETLDTKEMFTTLCGGMVVVKKVRKAMDVKLLPLIGTITRADRYYDIQ